MGGLKKFSFPDIFTFLSDIDNKHGIRRGRFESGTHEIRKAIFLKFEV